MDLDVFKEMEFDDEEAQESFRRGFLLTTQEKKLAAEKKLKEEEARREFRHGLLLTTQEKTLAKAKAEALKVRAQLELATAEAERARQEAEELREHIIATSTKTNIPNLRVVLTWSAILLLCLAVIRVTYLGSTRPSSSASIPDEPPSRHYTSSLSPSSHHPALGRKPAAAAGDQVFKLAMNRLQEDLDSFSGSESDIVREVNQKHLGSGRPCPLEWVNGEAALSLDGDDNHAPPSLLGAVTECADAVEKLRDEKEAALRAADPASH